MTRQPTHKSGHGCDSTLALDIECTIPVFVIFDEVAAAGIGVVVAVVYVFDDDIAVVGSEAPARAADAEDAIDVACIANLTLLILQCFCWLVFWCCWRASSPDVAAKGISGHLRFVACC